MGADGAVHDAAGSDDGMGTLSRDGFEPALLRLIAPWLGPGPGKTPVIACGMVGSRQGWAEVPYRAVPCKPGAAVPQAVETADPRLSLHIVPGISQAAPPDVMRGEETQIAGALADLPQFDGVLCLPGTHTKWAHVSAAEVVSFQTCMTGEIFALLSEHSVLRHSVGTGSLDRAAFLDAVSEPLSRPERLAQLLFAIRAEGLLQGADAPRARGRLSGLLIGAELAASRPYWLGQQVLVGGAEPMAGLYRAALEAQGVPVILRDAESLTLAGLRHAHAWLTETIG